MNCIGSGFITIINYANAGNSELDEDAILTESNDDLLTQNSEFILIES